VAYSPARRKPDSICDRWRRNERQFDIELLKWAVIIPYAFVAGSLNRLTLGHGYAPSIDIHQSVTTIGYQLVTNRMRTAAPIACRSR